MKAAVFKKLGHLEIEDVKTPECGADDILVKVEASAICSTDVKMVFHGHRDLVFPRILGHEVTGSILEIGKNVRHRYNEGAKVQIAPGISCGNCFYCTNNAQNMCESMKIIGFHYDGGFAQHLLIPKEGLYCGCINQIPENLPFEEAAFTEPVACCLNALQMVKIMTGGSVIIFGAGTVGCLFIQLVKLFGVSETIVVEKNEKRLNFSKKFEADYYIKYTTAAHIMEKINEVTKGKGVDYVILACSDSNLPSLGLRILSKRGCITFFSGLNTEKPEILIDYNLIHYKEIRVVGAYGCTSAQNKLALKLLSKGQVKVKEMISHHISLDEIKNGLEIVKEQKGMKVVINKL